MLNNCNWITPNWPAPNSVKALTTLRDKGYSQGAYRSFNLGEKSGEDLEVVLLNRKLLRETANLPAEPYWLKQVHGIDVVEVPSVIPSVEEVAADASVAFQPNQLCVVTTADCLPVLLCDKAGTRVSAIHAGWRGLAAGVIEAAIQKLKCDPESLLAWLGPAIGPEAFEVKEDVLAAFEDLKLESAFKPTGKGSWYADLYQLARERLKRQGIHQVFGGGFCTFQDEARFYSYRRSKVTGRMATLIWLDPLEIG